MAPLDSDVGLWVMDNGMLDAEGADRVGWARSTTDLASGGRSLIIDRDPVGWRVGDEVVVTPTDSDGYDTARITGILGRTITLDVPAATAHPLFDAGRGKVLGAEVLNVTRNVIIEGQPGHRSHMFIHSMMPQRIANAAFQHLGPQQVDHKVGSETFWKTVVGRYGVHFHHCGDASAWKRDRLLRRP